MTSSKCNCTVNMRIFQVKKTPGIPTTLLKLLFQGASLFILCCFSFAIDLETHDTVIGTLCLQQDISDVPRSVSGVQQVNNERKL